MVTIAFTPKDAEKAAVFTEKNQLVTAPGTLVAPQGYVNLSGLNEAEGSANDPIMAKEVAMKDYPVKWKIKFQKELNSLTE